MVDQHKSKPVSFTPAHDPWSQKVKIKLKGLMSRSFNRQMKNEALTLTPYSVDGDRKWS